MAKSSGRSSRGSRAELGQHARPVTPPENQKNNPRQRKATEQTSSQTANPRLLKEAGSSNTATQGRNDAPSSNPDISPNFAGSYDEPSGAGRGRISDLSQFDQQREKMRKHRRRRRILITCLIVVLVLILGGAGAAFGYMGYIQNRLQEDLPEDLLPELEASEPGDPFYMLLLGTDSSADRASSEEFEGDAFRTDSIMLLRIDPQEKKVTVISLLRDTMVDLGEYGVQKLNAAYAIGGPTYAVEVVSDLAGVPISHYAEIDFDGFKEVVDAIGGIEVDVPVTIDDDEAGGYLAAGEQTLDGDQALILCRSRHAYDSLGDGDAFRSANQRTVIAAIARKILSLDPVTMLNTVATLANYVTTDMTIYDISSLAYNLRGINMDTDFYTGSNPTESEYIDDVWWEVMDETEWKKMMARVNQGMPPTSESEVDEVTGIVISGSGDTATTDGSQMSSRVTAIGRTGTVAIRNGTDIDGAAAEAQAIINYMGYETDTGNANSSDYEQTIIVYDNPDQAQYAQEIADSLGIGVTVQNQDEYLYDTDFLVVIGSDWTQMQQAQAEAQ